MEFSEFAWRITLLFIPGLISFVIIDSLTIHQEIKIYKILIYSLILGFLCYAFYYLLVQAINWSFIKTIKFSFLGILADNKTSLDFKEIGFVAALSIIIGFISVALINYKILYRIARRLKISKKFGDVDVWSYIMNSKMPEWVVVRDIENDLMYEGWIEVFSDSADKNDELFLRDVIIFRNSTAEQLYETPGLYLSRKREKLNVEFPLLKFSKYKERPKKGEVK